MIIFNVFIFAFVNIFIGLLMFADMVNGINQKIVAKVINRWVNVCYQIFKVVSQIWLIIEVWLWII